MSKINYNDISNQGLFSPFILVREFEADPRIVLNPAFYRELGKVVHYREDRKFSVLEEVEDQIELISMKSRKEDIHKDTVAFSKQRNRVVLESFNTENYMEQYTGSSQLQHSEIMVGKQDSLVADTYNLYFDDMNNGRNNRFRLDRTVYDKNGVIDFKRYIEVILDGIKVERVAEIGYLKMLSLILGYKKYLDADLETCLNARVAGIRSHEIYRDSEFVEKANIKEVRNIDGERRIVCDSTTLYDMRDGFNNLYHMDYDGIIRLIDPLRQYAHWDQASIERLKATGKVDRIAFSPLSSEELLTAIKDNNLNEFAVAELIKRSEGRLIR